MQMYLASTTLMLLSEMKSTVQRILLWLNYCLISVFKVMFPHTYRACPLDHAYFNAARGKCIFHLPNNTMNPLAQGAAALVQLAYFINSQLPSGLMRMMLGI